MSGVVLFMSPLEHTLACLAEECAEVIQAVNKGLRFGLDDGHPDGMTNNAQDIVREVNDVLGVLEVLKDLQVPLAGLGCTTQIQAKRDKIYRMMRYAEGRGTLTATQS